ncbi:MAG: AAA family ATPase [Magnetococcales bacterium]|nr:AAA family ATPase [Magnetococcales bacterium]
MNFAALAPDPKAIATYFELVFGYCDGLIPLRGLTDPGQGLANRPHLAWIEADPLVADKALSFAQWAANNGSAFYVIPGTVAQRGQARADEVVQIQTVLVDLDAGNVEAKLAHLALHLGDPTAVIESGGVTTEGQNKLHAYWKLSEPAEGEDLALVCRLRHEIALKVGGDLHFRSAHQPIRVAGSVYHKHGHKRLTTFRTITCREAHLRDFAEAVADLPPMTTTDPDGLDFSLVFCAKPPVDAVLTTPVRAGGQDNWTRFEGASAAIGHYLRMAHENRMSLEEAWEAIRQYNAAMLRPAWSEERLSDETQRLWERHCERYGNPAGETDPSARELPSFRMAELLADDSPMPQDLIAPRLLTPGGLLVIGGAPKVGKSDLLIHLLAHMAAGREFLGFSPARPLGVFYLQTEIQYHYLRERMKSLGLPRQTLALAGVNLVTTPKVRIILNADGVARTVATIKKDFPTTPPDIICVDPLRNVFDGGPDSGGENDNSAMLFFLQERLERVREEVNPETGMILCHHTSKIDKKQLKEDPFRFLSGAGSLRGFYTSGLLMHRPDEERSERMLHFELRNGPALAPMLVDKREGRWVATDLRGERLVRQSIGEKLDAERRRKHDVILQLIYDEALQGRAYTPSQFAEHFENKAGLGGSDTIIKRIHVLATNGYLKFFRNPQDYGLPSAIRSKLGYLCVEGMLLGSENEESERLPVLPTHFKDLKSGAMLPVEKPEVWICQDEAIETDKNHSH